jgi:hypothetical protein
MVTMMTTSLIVIAVLLLLFVVYRYVRVWQSWDVVERYRSEDSGGACNKNCGGDCKHQPTPLIFPMPFFPELVLPSVNGSRGGLASGSDNVGVSGGGHGNTGNDNNAVPLSSSSAVAAATSMQQQAHQSSGNAANVYAPNTQQMPATVGSDSPVGNDTSPPGTSSGSGTDGNNSGINNSGSGNDSGNGNNSGNNNGGNNSGNNNGGSGNGNNSSNNSGGSGNGNNNGGSGNGNNNGNNNGVSGNGNNSTGGNGNGNNNGIGNNSGVSGNGNNSTGGNGNGNNNGGGTSELCVMELKQLAMQLDAVKNELLYDGQFIIDHWEDLPVCGKEQYNAQYLAEFEKKQAHNLLDYTDSFWKRNVLSCREPEKTKKILTTFLDSGGDPNARIRNSNNKNDYTLLHLMILCGWTDMIDKLMEKGADIHARVTAANISSVFLALHDPAVLKHVITRHKANVNDQDFDGMTPLMYVPYGIYYRIADTWEQVLDVTRILFNNGADAFLSNNEGKTVQDLIGEYKDKEFNDNAMESRHYWFVMLEDFVRFSICKRLKLQMCLTRFRWSDEAVEALT